MKINDETKDLMLRFIKLKCNYTIDVVNVLNITLKADDDDYGPAGKHYVVEVLVVIPDFGYTSAGKKNVNNTCLVNRNEFQRFVDSENAVIWL